MKEKILFFYYPYPSYSPNIYNSIYSNKTTVVGFNSVHRHII
jgi:hypothetical protein